MDVPNRTSKYRWEKKMIKLKRETEIFTITVRDINILHQLMDQFSTTVHLI